MEYYINLNSVYRVDVENKVVEEYITEGCSGWQLLLHITPSEVRHQDGFLWVSKKKANEVIDQRQKELMQRLKELRDKEIMDSGIIT